MLEFFYATLFRDTENKQAQLRLAIYKQNLKLLYYLEITEKAFMENTNHGIKQ